MCVFFVFMDDCPTTTWTPEPTLNTSWVDDDCLGTMGTTPPVVPPVITGIVFRGTLLSVLGIL